MKYDLIVVGAGPAGLTAAKTAAEDGAKVLLIERKKDVTEVNRLCAQFTNIRLINVGGKLKYGYTEPIAFEFGTDKTQIHFPAVGFSIDYSGPTRSYYNYIHFSPSGYRVYREKDRLIAFFCQKESLLAGLLDSVVKAGTEVLTETIGMGAESTPDGVKVFVRGKSGERTFEARKAIAADGSSSRIAESLGLNKKRRVLGGGGVAGLAGYVVEGVETELRINSYLCFTIPDLGRLNFWMFMIAGDRNVVGGGGAGLDAVNKFMKLPFFEPWFRHVRIVGKIGTAGGSGARTPIWEPVAGNVLVIGDASALVEVTNPGAIACGYLGAKATLKEMNGQSGYPEYIDWWQKSFDTNDPDYLKAAARLVSLNALCNNEETDYLYQVIQGQVGVPAVTVAKNLALVKADRPQLYEKLKGMGVDSDVKEMKMDLGQALTRKKPD